MVIPVATNQTILVVGGGISGMTAAIEAAECGKHVILLEKGPSLGGRVSQLYKYFPKLCIPSCGLEINLRRFKANQNIQVITLAQVRKIDGESGDYSVQIKTSPRFVNKSCTACGDCEAVVNTEYDDEHNHNMKKRKGAYLPFNMAYPRYYETWVKTWVRLCLSKPETWVRLCLLNKPAKPGSGFVYGQTRVRLCLWSNPGQALFIALIINSN